MKKWLSFIVPIYNAEKYLAECVESLIKQNFPLDKYEIILYDDSSTDMSLVIAENYAKQYENIRVFTHPNAGVSKTRNAALKEAVGKYIWFVDSDDFIVKDILPVFYEWLAKDKVDMLIFDSVRFNESRFWKLRDFAIKETPIISGIDAFMGFYYDPVPWNKLLRRAFIEKHHLYFAQQLSEDSEWGTRCFYHAERVKAIPLDAICYRVSDSSLSHNEANRKALVGGLLECLENHYNYMILHPNIKFWMRALVLDLRRLHNVGLNRVVCSKDEKRAFFDREQRIVRKITLQLHVSFKLDYAILLICAISPVMILRVQNLLRRIKYLKSKINYI